MNKYHYNCNYFGKKNSRHLFLSRFDIDKNLFMVSIIYSFFFSLLVVAVSSLTVDSAIATMVEAEQQLLTKLETSSPVFRVIFDDAVQSLDNGNTSKTIQNLDILNKILLDINENSTSLQVIKLLLADAIQAINNNDTNKASVYLNLVGKQLDIVFQDSENTNTIIYENNSNTKTTQLTASETNKSNFLFYNSSAFGIKIKYPDDWSVREYVYTPGTNNTIVGFYSNSKTASELGNISGVSGSFVPYLDIFVFDSKNISLDNIVDSRINKIKNTSNFLLYENDTKRFTINENQTVISIVYSVVTGGDEIFKKIQIYTIFNNKVYLVTFTAQDALFSEYLPKVQEMIRSLEIRNSPLIK